MQICIANADVHDVGFSGWGSGGELAAWFGAMCAADGAEFARQKKTYWVFSQ